MFLVCAPGDNDALLRGGRVLDDFRALLREPGTVGLLLLDGLIDPIDEVAGGRSEWALGLRDHYARI
jgi:hypothetical protein